MVRCGMRKILVWLLFRWMKFKLQVRKDCRTLILRDEHARGKHQEIAHHALLGCDLCIKDQEWFSENCFAERAR